MKDLRPEPTLTAPRLFTDDVVAAFSALGAVGLAAIPYGLVYAVLQVAAISALCAGLVGGAVLAFVTGGLAIPVLLVLAVVIGLAGSAVTAWLHQGLLATHLDHLRYGQPQAWNAGLRAPARWDLYAFLVAYQFALGIGTVALYLPAVVIEACFSGVAPAVLGAGVPLGTALRSSMSRFWAAPLRSLGYTLLDNLLAMVLLSALPILGGILAAHVSHHLQARAWWIAQDGR
jgi:hypothetical protein